MTDALDHAKHIQSLTVNCNSQIITLIFLCVFCSSRGQLTGNDFKSNALTLYQKRKPLRIKRLSYFFQCLKGHFQITLFPLRSLQGNYTQKMLHFKTFSNLYKISHCERHFCIKSMYIVRKRLSKNLAAMPGPFALFELVYLLLLYYYYFVCVCLSVKCDDNPAF